MYLFVSFSFAGHFFFSSFGALVLVSERQIVLYLQWDRLPPPPRTHQQNKTKPRNKSHQKLPIYKSGPASAEKPSDEVVYIITAL
jgi:hypothetical protein